MTTNLIRYTIVLMPPNEPPVGTDHPITLQPGDTISPSATQPLPPQALSANPPQVPLAPVLPPSPAATSAPVQPIVPVATPLTTNLNPQNPYPLPPVQVVPTPAAGASFSSVLPETYSPPFEAQIPAAEAATLDTDPEYMDAVSWVAPEYVGHDKSLAWYLRLAGAAVVASFLVWLLTKDKISAAVVLIGAAVFGGYGARQPHTIQYQLDNVGVSLNGKYYDLDIFRSFSIDREGAYACINFMPLKRFAPGLTIYYAPNHEERILDLIATTLPTNSILTTRSTACYVTLDFSNTRLRL